ncbi:hypothetical protein HMPREF1982_03767 [Clostridiales bacterium oral taxon 876 str. F0540]|nr:hypothetical protein HMPREF1982_03767 [Clostridiales bacterium oral taxon 876 str. F0540]
MAGGINMEMVCPNCNELNAKSFSCANCGERMTDLGRAQEVYQDDYTANMPINDAYDYCIHVFKCSTCGYNEKFQIKKINA